MGRIYTSQIGYTGVGRLDITIKSASGLGKVLAPTWAMVGGVKGWRRYKPLTPQEYTERYYELLRHRYTTDNHPFIEILARDIVVLVCYCPSHAFCHRHIAVDILAKIAQANGIPIVCGGELPVC